MEKKNMKKYEEPKAEKLEFDYSDNVVASRDCPVGGKGTSGNTYNNDPNGQYYKCTCTTYYAPGWGQNC